MLLVWSVYPTFCIRQDDETIGRTPNPLASAIQDVGIDHRRFHVTMAQQLLHRFGRKARNAESQVETKNLKRTLMERSLPEWEKSARGWKFSP